MVTYSVGNASPIEKLIFYLHQQSNQKINSVIIALCFDDFREGQSIRDDMVGMVKELNLNTSNKEVKGTIKRHIKKSMVKDQTKKREEPTRNIKTKRTI